MQREPLYREQRTLRIALVSETFPPEINGVAMTLGRLVDGLRRRGHAIDLIRPRQHSGEIQRQDMDFSELLVGGLPIPGYEDLRFGLPAVGRLKKRWSALPPDIVHVVTEGPLGWSAVAAATHLGLPVSSSFHTNFQRYSQHYRIGWLNRPITAYLRKLHNRTRATLVPTQALRGELAQNGFDNLHVLSRGVDTALFNPARRSIALRGQWGAKGNEPVMLYAGRLAAEKNLRVAVEAFLRIRAERTDAKLVFVGDGPLRKQLERLCPQAIFTGMRTGTELAAHYASADIFLFPSLTETFGNVTGEALASGLGVVAFRHAGAAELIAHGRNGLLAAPGDSAGFIEAACDLAGVPQKLRSLRAAASASVAHLDWERIHDRFAALLADVAGKPRKAMHHGSADLVLAQD